MATYTQANRSLSITTPLGSDALLLEKLSGSEGLSQPFEFRLELLAEKAIAFDKLVGEAVHVELRPPHVSSPRYFHGVVGRLYQGGRVRAPDEQTMFIRYRLDLVPKFWTLQKRVQSRIFHDLSVLEILQQVLKTEGKLEVSQSISHTDHFPKHNYRVQYQESDFAFASRLMEEAGLFYYFKHTASGHEMVIADDSPLCPGLSSPARVRYDEVEGGTRHEPRITAWEKLQELCPGQFALADYHFELPRNDLSAQQVVQGQVAVGTVTHSLQAGNHGLAVHAYPGQYTSHFDSVDASGMVSLPTRLDPVYQEKDWRAKVLMEQAAAEAVQIQGTSDCGHFTAGCKFELADHFDANGQYVLTQVEHNASLEGSYTTGAAPADFYRNRFHCLPAALPFRPPSVTARPRIVGTQTAVVVGPLDLDPPVDKYGRVKVQFHWDDKKKASNSCWVRVGQSWAGNRWGAFFWPRIGHEVIVAFENGDPDRPIIVGSVYNADNMPPFELPEHSSTGGIKSCSIGGDPMEQFCSFVFHDELGNEHLHLHSEKDAGHTSEVSRLHHLAGHNFELLGRLPVPSAGSGSGGGLMDIVGVAGLFSPGAQHFEEEYLPGSYNMVCGDLSSITFAGTRYSQILGGADVKLSFDLEAILASGIGSLFHAAPGAVSKAPFVEAGLIGVGGDVSLTYGPKVASVYNGDITIGPKTVNIGKKVDIIRGEELKFSNEGWHGDFGKPAFALNALTLGTALAGAVLTYIYGSTKPPPSPNDGTSEPSEKNRASLNQTPWYAKMLSTTVYTRWHGLLNAAEMAYGEATRAAKAAAEAQKVLAAATANVAAQLNLHVQDLATLTTQYTQLSTNAAAAAAKLTAAEAKATAAETKATAAETKVAGASFDYNKDYTLSAHNLKLLAKKDDSDGQSIDLSAGKTADFTSFITARAAGHVGLTAGTAATLWLGQSSATESKINLQNNLLGSIGIQQGAIGDGPLIKLDGSTVATPSIELKMGAAATAANLKLAGGATPSIKLSVGTGASEASLELAATGITMKFGAGATEGSLKLAATGIEMKFGNGSVTMATAGVTLETKQKAKVTVAGTDVQIEGVNIKETAKAQAEVNAAIMKDVAQAVADAKAALAKTE